MRPRTQSKPREWREPWLPKGVRRVGRDRFQFRAYIGPCRIGVYPVNMGIYPSEHAAKLVARRFWQLMAAGTCISTITDTMIVEGLVSPMITNRVVCRVSGGWGIHARSRGAKVFLSGPYSSPSAARSAASDWLNKLGEKS
jgi:hypothetical protein